MDMGQMCSTAVYGARDDGLLDAQYRAFVPMDFMQYLQSPVMRMDCGNSFKCKWDVEGYERDDGWDENFELGILATDYDNWYVMYGCGDWWNGTGQMQWLTIHGREERISDEQLDAAKAAIAAKLPSFDLSPLWMKDGVQGDWALGLGKCEYEW